MKYYKLLTKLGYLGDCFIIDKIYPETFKQSGNSSYMSVLEIQRAYPKDWQKVPAGDYFVQEGKMPEYFAIKRVEGNPLWGKYIDWLNNTYFNDFLGCIDEYYGFDSKGCLHKNLKYFKNNPVELTLEQWDKIINKTMEENDKEIIGWKLKDDCNQYKQAALNICNTVSNWENSLMPYDISTKQTGYITRLEKAGVLELWFEPVYKQNIVDIKEGDFIYIIDARGADGDRSNTKYNRNILKVITFKPEENENFSDSYWITHTPESFSGGGFRVHSSAWQYNIHFRKATPEEIKAAQTPQITINGYKGEFFDNYVKFGCAQICSEFFIELYRFIDDWKSSDISNKFIESVAIGKGTFTKDQIKEIATYYLNKK